MTYHVLILAIGTTFFILSGPSPALASLNSRSNHAHGRGLHRSWLRSTRQQPMPVEGPTLYPIFNPKFAQRERKNTLIKYEQAPELLQGIGLHPRMNISFINDFPSFQDPSTVFAFPNNTLNGTSGPPLISPATLPLAKLPLEDYISGSLDILYYGPLEFGTPSQQLSVDIDTGSADLWVVSTACDSCTSPQFDANASQSCRNDNEDFSIAYGSGEVFGSLVQDTVTIAGLTSKQQDFGIVDTESPDFAGYPNSGILGLAFGSISTSGRPTLFENLMDSGEVFAPFFSVHLTRNKRQGSEVCFGCYDVTKSNGVVKWAPVVSKTYWTVPMNGMKSNGVQMQMQSSVVAAIDTGTTLIYVPDSMANVLYDSIPGAKAIDQFGPGFFSYPCSSSPVISFTFGGNEFALNAVDFNLGRVSARSPDCVGGILSLGSDFPGDLAIIGDEFLKSWYTVYDYSNGARVGFASSINNA